MRRILLALTMTLALGACSADETPQAEPKSDGDVPTKTVPVYLATALACRYLDREDVSFVPLVVEGPGYTTTIEPSEDCAEQSMFNTYVFEVPMPGTGEVTVSPGDQPEVTLNAAKVRKSKGVTVFYARKGDGAYEVSVTRPGRDKAMEDAGR